MAQRLVLSAEDGKIPLWELAQFAETAVNAGIRAESASYVVGKGDTVKIMVTLPKDVRVVGKKAVQVKPKSKREQAAEEQISTHRAKGKDKPGYVPPVGKNAKPKPTKTECPVCKAKKPVQTVGGVRIIKPHVVKGNPCSGGGKQVVAKRRIKK